MGMEQIQKYCRQCQSQQLHARPGTNHILHLLITVLLCGFWIPIWILSSLKIGEWRCQKCGVKAGGGVMGLFALVLVVLAGLFTYRMVSGWGSRVFNPTGSLTSLRPNELGESNSKSPSEENSRPRELDPQPAPAARKVSPKVIESQPTLPIQSVYLKSLDGIPLPVIVVTDDVISLLDATGKEFPIAAGKKILVTDRSPGGTLKMVIDSKLFVGNESRLSGRVRIDRK